MTNELAQEGGPRGHPLEPMKAHMAKIINSAHDLKDIQETTIQGKDHNFNSNKDSYLIENEIHQSVYGCYSYIHAGVMWRVLHGPKAVQ